MFKYCFFFLFRESLLQYAMLKLYLYVLLFHLINYIEASFPGAGKPLLTDQFTFGRTRTLSVTDQYPQLRTSQVPPLSLPMTHIHDDCSEPPKLALASGPFSKSENRTMISSLL